MKAAGKSPAVTGQPLVLLRLEGAALLVLACMIYTRSGASWWLFAILFLAPDISFLGYIGGPRLGALIYNAVHAMIAPTALAAAGLALRQPTTVAVAIIWFAHIGFDRMLGYGLKYDAGFGFTHLGPLGKDE